MKILDCTLRDGGYYTNWDFDDKLIEEYFHAMQHLPVEYIEIGYRSFDRSDYFGSFYYLPNYLIKKIKAISGRKKIAIMVNEKEVKPDTLLPLIIDLKNEIDLIRFAVDPNHFERAIRIIKVAKKHGFKTAINLMYISKHFKNRTLFEKIKCEQEWLDFVFLVDSYGSMYPYEVENLVLTTRKYYKGNLGFHGHNNLELAFANALLAANAGCNYIDTTLTGMGRGAGNLRTELLLTHIGTNGISDVDLNILAKVIEFWESLKEKHKWGTIMPYIISGATETPQKHVMEWVNKRCYSYNTIVRAITTNTNKKKSEIKIKKFKPNKEIEQVLIVGGGPTIGIHKHGIIEFLKKNPELTIIHTSSRNINYFKDLTNYQIHCLIGNEGNRLEENLNGLDINNRIAVLAPKPRNMGTYIPNALKNSAYEIEQYDYCSDESRESSTALALQIASTLSAKNVFIIGYDGYIGNITKQQMELFNENQTIINYWNTNSVTIKSLTPTKYKVNTVSIYSML